MTLWGLCRFFDFPIGNVTEVGCASAGECRSRDFILNGVPVSLVEPHPGYFTDLEREYGWRPNVRLHNAAVANRDGEVGFFMNGSSSFIADIDRPPTVTDGGYRKEMGQKITVPCRRWGDWVDDGKIDLLLLDMEGAEWYVIRELKSIPKIIAVETHCENRYRNPFLDEIQDWLETRTYKVLFANTSDTYYIRGLDLGWGNGGIKGWKL